MDDLCNEPDIALSDDDVVEAMRSIPGYLDITPSDFREIYRLAFRHACTRLRESVRAGDIMTSPVISVRLDTPLAEVAALMAKEGISGLPVLSADGGVAGVISEKDFLRRLGVLSECLHRDGCAALTVRTRLARDIMTAPAVTVSPRTSLAELTDLFARKGINRAPVLDGANTLVGIVTRGDVIRAPLMQKAKRP